MSNDYDGDDYDYDYDEDENSYYDEHDFYIPPCPEVTIANVLRKWIGQLKLKWFNLRHGEDVSDIPF
jgi:hypothetical protein